MVSDFETVGLPIEVLAQIEKLIKNNSFGYKSIEEFVSEACRHHIMNSIINQKEQLAKRLIGKR